MTILEQLDVFPLDDAKPIGYENRRARHRVCGTEITFSRNIAPPDTYSLKCPCCGPLGEVQSPMIDRIDRAAIRGDGTPVAIEVFRG